MPIHDTTPPITSSVAVTQAALWNPSRSRVPPTIVESIAKRKAAEKRHAQEKTALVTTAALTALPILLQSSLMRKVGIPVGGALAAAFLLSKSNGHHHADDDTLD